MNQADCVACSDSGVTAQGDASDFVPLTVLSEHPHLAKPLKSLVAQVETDVRYDKSDRVVHCAHIPDQAIRPLFTTVRSQARNWVAVLAESWTYGRVRAYVEFCESVCLVGDSEGMPATEREADFKFPPEATHCMPEHGAWACLQAGASRERNQRPRTIGPIKLAGPMKLEDVAGPMKLEDVLNWRHLIEILGLPLQKDHMVDHFNCVDATRRVVDLLPDDLEAEIRAVAQDGVDELSATLKERCLAELNALLDRPTLLLGANEPSLSRIRAVRSLRNINITELPSRERLKVNRYMLEASLLKLQNLAPGAYSDQVITKLPLTPFVSPALIALPLYARKPSRLNGMICLYGKATEASRVKAANRVLSLADRLIAEPLNTQLALLESTYRVGQTDFQDEVVEVVFHLARKYVGANDLCLRVLSGDKAKMFSCKSDCQYHHDEFGPVQKQSRAQRFNEIAASSGTVGDNLHSDRQGEIIGHLLDDSRHLKAADEAEISHARFRDNSGLLVKTEMGEYQGIAALHHIERMFYDPADFVLLKIMLRTAEMRIGELVRNRFINSFISSQRSTADLQSRVKQDLLWELRTRVIEILEDKLARNKLDGLALVALVSGENRQVLELFKTSVEGERLLDSARFREQVYKESKGFGSARSLWVRQGKQDLWVDTSYDLSESKLAMAQSAQQLERPAAKSACVVVVGIPGENIGQLWIEWQGEIPSEAPPFTDRELVNVGEAASQISQLLEETWGWKMAEDAGRGTTADIVDHNLGHLHLAAERQLYELKHMLGALPAPTLDALSRFERTFLDLRATSSKLANMSRRLAPENIEVSEWLRRMHDRLALPAQMSGVRLNTNLAGPEARISVDVDVINAAVLEVFMNSVDAMENQKEKLFHIDIAVEDRRVKCMLSDNGPGIDESDWPLVFKHDHSRKTKADNHRGLGLYAAKMYVDLNRGGIRAIRSSHGGGACFALTFNKVGVE
jgi:anti-sigma regulatory factor (Ser/Thr protein kinase)